MRCVNHGDRDETARLSYGILSHHSAGAARSRGLQAPECIDGGHHDGSYRFLGSQKRGAGGRLDSGSRYPIELYVIDQFVDGRFTIAESVTVQSVTVQSVTAQSATAQSATAQSATAQSATAQYAHCSAGYS